jgi:hypothetical protein
MVSVNDTNRPTAAQRDPLAPWDVRLDAEAVTNAFHRPTR